MKIPIDFRSNIPHNEEALFTPAALAGMENNKDQSNSVIVSISILIIILLMLILLVSPRLAVIPPTV